MIKEAQSLDGYPAHGTGVSYSGTSGGTSQGPKKMGLNRVNDPDLYLKGQKGQVGSKTALNGKGGSSTGGYAAQGTGVSNSGTLGRTSGESSSHGSGGTTIGSEGTITGKKGKPTDSKGTAIGSGKRLPAAGNDYRQRGNDHRQRGYHNRHWHHHFQQWNFHFNPTIQVVAHLSVTKPAAKTSGNPKSKHVVIVERHDTDGSTT